MKNKTVLITGATGIMGSWILGEALDRGYQPVVLMRDKDLALARERIGAVLDLVERGGDVSRVRIVRGDARFRGFGLDAGLVEELRGTLGAMVHCAACTSFNPRQDEELWATNVGGVANMLHFLAETNIPLYHVSTAYVAGKRLGRVLETELDENQEFNNTYEQSKCEAEKLVHAAVAKGTVRAAIFRPGILVGGLGHGRITQFLNFYQFLRFIDYASSPDVDLRGRLRVRGKPEGTKNLVPVDWSARAMWHIIETDGPSGQTYHLTNPKPITHLSLQHWATSYLGLKEIRLVDRLESPYTALEVAANSAFRLYEGYMKGEPEFDVSNTLRALGDALSFPRVGPELYTTMLKFARERRWEGIFGCETKAARVKGVPKARTAAAG